VTPLRATVYSSVRDDRDALMKGVELWRSLGPETSPQIAFQLASALQGVVDLTRVTEGVVGVLNRDRELMREARVRYSAAASHEDADDRLRLVALVNCGNLYDSMGRDVDALRYYDRALDIDSTFGMGLGNRGMALLKVASFMGGHESHVLEEAAWLLDRALEDEARIRDIGGQDAIETFRQVRSTIVGDEPESPDHGGGPQFADPHLRWAYEHRLLLHISPACLTDNATSVDPLHLGSMVWSITKAEHARLQRLRDAFNTVKQEYLAARYSLWLATEPGSPIREQTQTLSARGYFADTLAYARWGIQTGMGIQALTAATNTLDKIAGLVHLYFATERKPKDISFYSLWHAPRTKADKGKPLRVEPVFAEQLRDVGNEGLAAILDLSCEIEGDEHQTPLKKQIAWRRAATHRYLVAHGLPLYESDSAKWLERVDWADIVAGTIEQLRVSRAALIYLARAIQARENARDHKGETIPDLPTWAIQDFDTEP
jgi:tetratricopeptide (TPR) repeat protein